MGGSVDLFVSFFLTSYWTFHGLGYLNSYVLLINKTFLPTTSHGYQAVQGGVSIDLSEMNAILEVNAEDLDCRVQAGVTRLALNQDLRYTGILVESRNPDGVQPVSAIVQHDVCL